MTKTCPYCAKPVSENHDKMLCLLIERVKILARAKRRDYAVKKQCQRQPTTARLPFKD